MKVLKTSVAVGMGFSPDKRKRRRQHRKAAINLLRRGGFFNYFSARGSTFGDVAAWHLWQARVI